MTDTFGQITIYIVDWILFIILCLPSLYLIFYAIASKFSKRYIYQKSPQKRRYLVIIPAYAEDGVIVDTAVRMTDQTYDIDKYKICVVSDHHKEETNTVLGSLSIQTIIASYKESSKAKALKLAMASQTEDFDKVVILDADNMVEPTFLENLNDICQYGYSAIQCHRLATPTRQNAITRLDAISEEINNAIFRKGHINLGLSSALIGSGMCFDYDWFKRNVNKLSSTGEDKELEKMLISQHIHIHYAEDLYVYDEKVKYSENFKNQRRRWIAVQLECLAAMIKDLPKALKPLNIDYIDKTIQQAILPRLLHASALILMCILSTLILSHGYCKWWMLLFVYVIAMYIATPAYYKSKETLKMLLVTPRLALVTIVNLFHLKNATKIFIHTKHGK